MNHTDINELLSAYSNGELAATQREFVEEHLGTCDECRADLDSYNQVREQLTSLRALTVPDSIREATMARIGTTGHAGGRTKNIFRSALAAAALALALIVPLWFLMSGGDSVSAVAKAYAATESLVSYSLEGVTRSELRGQVTETAFQWDIIDDERSQGGFTTDGSTIEFVIDGEDQYARGASPGLVVTIEDESILSRPIPRKQSMLDLLDTLGPVAQLPDETVDGIKHLRRRGSVDMDKVLDDLIAKYRAESRGTEADYQALEIQRQAEVAVDLWIDADTFFITRLVMFMRLPTTTHHGDGTTSIDFSLVSSDVRYSNLNDPIALELPRDPAGDLLAGWQLGTGDTSPDPPTVEGRVVGE